MGLVSDCFCCFFSFAYAIKIKRIKNWNWEEVGEIFNEMLVRVKGIFDQTNKMIFIQCPKHQLF